MQVFIVSLRLVFSSLMPCLHFQNNSFIEFTTHPYPGISYPPIEEDRSATMPRLDGRKAKLRQGSHLSALPGSEEHLSGRQAAIQLYQLVKSVSMHNFLRTCNVRIPTELVCCYRNCLLHVVVTSLVPTPTSAPY